MGQCTDQEREQVHRWYDSLGKKIPEAEVFHDEAHAQQVRAALERGIAASLPPVAKREPSARPLWRYTKAAAAIGLLLVAAWVIWQSLPGKWSGTREIDYHVLEVPVGKTARMQLADGSSVWLNANSRLRYPLHFTGNTREVYLEEGEAFFEVKRNEKKPFQVHASHLAVRVLGTSFNVKAYSAARAVTVAVATGKVAVSNANKQLSLLTPNEVLRYELSSGQYSTRQADVNALSTWRQGKLVFQQASFAEVAQQLENKYGVTLTFSNRALQNCRFTAQFAGSEPLTDVLSVLSLLHNTRFNRTGNQVTITGEGCNYQP